MTVHQLDVLPRDVAAGALGLLLDGPRPEPLVGLRLAGGDGRAITLGLLGASHVVVATAGGRHVTEEVSCDAVGAGGRPLPRRFGFPGYDFCSTVTRTGRADLEATAGRLRALAAEDAASLCGAFPGSGSALTAMTARPSAGGWAWQTWHLYPAGDTGDVVVTQSRWTP